MSNDEISGLLPFYVNGTLDADETARVEAARRANPGLDTEIALLRTMRETVKDEHDATAGSSPSELGLHRLLREIDSDSAATIAAPPHISGVSTVRLSWGSRWGALAVAACLALVIGFGAGTLLSPVEEAGFLAASDSSGETAVLTVAFAGDARAADIAVLLRENGLSIVAGPSALGLYRIAAAPDATDVDTLVERLSTRPDLIVQVARAQ